MLLAIVIVFIAWLYFEIKRKSWHTLALGVLCVLLFYLGGHWQSLRYAEVNAKNSQKPAVIPKYDKLLFLEEEAMDAYLHASPEAGIWALERLVAFLEDEKNPIWNGSFYNENDRCGDLVLARTRLALALRKAGREKEAEKMLALASNSARLRYNEEATAENLILMVSRLDDKKRGAAATNPEKSQAPSGQSN